MKMKVKLLNLDPFMPKFRIILDKLPVIVGRSPDAGIRLDDRWISRVHCEIDQVDGTLVVRDLESRNGRLVNGEHVTEAHLMPGDRLTVGTTSFQVQYRRSSMKSSADIEHETTSQR